MLDAPDKAMGHAWLLLIARILMMLLFVLFGWEKLMNFGATANSFAGLGLPLPKLATCVSIVVELGFGLAIVVGFLTRPLALLLAVYTIIIGVCPERRRSTRRSIFTRTSPSPEDFSCCT